MKFTGKYYKTNGKKNGKPIIHTGGQIFVCKELANSVQFQHKEELIMEYDDNTKVLTIRSLNP